MENLDRITIDKYFIDEVLKSKKHTWPFEDDFSDVEAAYTEAVGGRNGVRKYVLLKKDCLMVLEYAAITDEVTITKIYDELTITKIALDKIISCRETSKSDGNVMGFKNERVHIVLQSGAYYDLVQPYFRDKFQKDSAEQTFIENNLANYNYLINQIMK